MRRTFGFTATLLVLTAAPALADPLPPGWSQREDGAYVHQPSTAVCPAELAGYKRTSLDAGSPPVLGVCNYNNGPDLIGAIRVRAYVPGQGETPMAIENDRRLMEPGSTTVSAIRMPPVAIHDGVRGPLRLIITVAHGGVLIDCDDTYPWTDPPRDFKTSFAALCSDQFNRDRQ